MSKVITWNDVMNYTRKGSPIPDRRIEKSPDEWKKQLSLEQFRVTRSKGTEFPFSGEYCESHSPGTYACICCGQPLFESGLKFDSGTGWPSFTQPIIENAIAYHLDESHGMIRVEVLCSCCDAHLGHVFPDGPSPSGLRYCINSVSLVKMDSIA